MRPKKSLGQNFLVNRNAAARIASLLDLKPTDCVIEIGGGRGDLTTHLLDTGADVICIEFDREMVAVLSDRFAGKANLHLIQSDILQIDPAVLLSGRSGKLAGNIPYNLTSPILEWTILHRACFSEVVLMMQKEVAARLAASPGTKDFGSLTLFVQLFFDVEKMFTLKPGSFFPKPTVDSAVVRLQRLQQSRILDSEYGQFRRLSAACFRWRRKTILRILREEYQLESSVATQLVTSLSLELNTRPEQMTVVNFVALMRKLQCIVSGLP